MLISHENVRPFALETTDLVKRVLMVVAIAAFLVISFTFEMSDRSASHAPSPSQIDLS